MPVNKNYVSFWHCSSRETEYIYNLIPGFLNQIQLSTVSRVCWKTKIFLINKHYCPIKKFDIKLLCSLDPNFLYFYKYFATLWL